MSEAKVTFVKRSDDEVLVFSNGIRRASYRQVDGGWVALSWRLGQMDKADCGVMCEDEETARRTAVGFL